MKILLLLSGLLFSGGLFADMDNMCVVVEVDGQNTHSKIKKCKRNNILVLQRIRNLKTEWESVPVLNYIAQFCRHDRQINYELNQHSNTYELVCVLYSNEQRTYEN